MKGFSFLINDCLLNIFGKEVPLGFRIYESQRAFFGRDFEHAKDEFIQRRAHFINDFKRSLQNPISGGFSLVDYNRHHPTDTENSIWQHLADKSFVEREAYWEKISRAKIRDQFRDTFNDKKKENIISALYSMCLNLGFELVSSQKRDYFSLSATDGCVTYTSNVDDIGRTIIGKMNFIHELEIPEKSVIRFSTHALLPDMELYDKVYGAPAFCSQKKYESDEFLLNILVNFVVGFSFVASSDATVSVTS